MRHLLNTLYLNIDGAYVARDGETVDIRSEGRSLRKFPIHLFENIVCFGRISLSPGAMHLCADHGVAVSFMTVYGRFIAKLTAPVHGNVLLRRSQYRKADDPIQSAEIARAIIAAKIANSRTVLQRAARDGKESEPYEQPIRNLAVQLQKIRTHEKPDLDTLRGIEGDSAGEYFSCFDHMILSEKEQFYFRDRNRRPPTDRINALLSFGYSLLAAEITSALESVGLDPCVGFLHRDRPGRPSLALDLMEELRAYLVDRFVLSLVNLRKIAAADFTVQENGAVLLNEAPRKEIFLQNWQNRKQEEITHPYLQEKIPLGLLPYVQAMLLARFLRGDLDGYPPFFLK